MGHRYRALRRRILTPDTSATKLDVRGFHRRSPDSQELLETIGRTFLSGYAYAAEAKETADAEDRLETIPARFRGFAYEGAGMGFAVRDGLPLGGSGHVRGLLAGRGDAHIYMVYVGIGWAMARLPRFRWPATDGMDPLLRWLVLDGYGFHQAYFHTRRYVHERYQDARFPWPADDPHSYANHAIDQGIGRALWFVAGTDSALVAATVDRFPESRRADLYGGVGLAATYAGGADERELRALWEYAGPYRSMLAQGCSFAAEARERAGLVVPHNEEATRILCGTTVAEAARISRDTRPEPEGPGEPPAFETWRQRIAAAFDAHARGTVPAGGQAT